MQVAAGCGGWWLTGCSDGRLQCWLCCRDNRIPRSSPKAKRPARDEGQGQRIYENESASKRRACEQAGAGHAGRETRKLTQRRRVCNLPCPRLRSGAQRKGSQEVTAGQVLSSARPAEPSCKLTCSRCTTLYSAHAWAQGAGRWAAHELSSWLRKPNARGPTPLQQGLLLWLSRTRPASLLHPLHPNAHLCGGWARSHGPQPS